MNIDVDHLGIATQQAFEIHRYASASQYGEILSEMPRYWRFKPEDCSLEDWVKLIGPNGAVLSHLEETLRTAVWFLRSELLENPGMYAQEEIEVFLAAAVSHDFGEAIVSDIP